MKFFSEIEGEMYEFWGNRGGGIRNLELMTKKMSFYVDETQKCFWEKVKLWKILRNFPWTLEDV